MFAYIKRFIAVIMIFSLIIPAYVAAETSDISFTLDKKEYAAGETITVTWSCNPDLVDPASITMDLVNYVTDNKWYKDSLTESHEVVIIEGCYKNTDGLTEGTVNLKVPESFNGECRLQVNYFSLIENVTIGTWEAFSASNANYAAPDPFFDVSFSKHYNEWQAGDKIKLTLDYSDSLKNGSGEFVSFFAGFHDGTIDGLCVEMTTPGATEFTIPSLVEAYVLEALVSLRIDGLIHTYYLVGVASEDPGYAPTTAPSANPSSAPTTAPSANPSSAPTAAPSTNPTSAPTNAPSEPVELNLDSITIGAKQTVDTVKVVSGASVNWASSDEKIATVDSTGKITGVKKGKAIITAVSESGETDTVEVTVVAKNKGVKKIKLSKKKASIKQGEKLVLEATLTPAGAKNKKILWTSSDTSVATVDAKGKVKAVGIGKATITAISSSGKTAKCEVTVTGAKVKKITIEGKKNMKVGDMQTLVATIKPDFAENQALKWKSSNKKLATVDENGVVTALKKGTVTITAAARDGSKVKAAFIIKIKK